MMARTLEQIRCDLGHTRAKSRRLSKGHNPCRYEHVMWGACCCPLHNMTAASRTHSRCCTRFGSTGTRSVTRTYSAGASPNRTHLVAWQQQRDPLQLCGVLTPADHCDAHKQYARSVGLGRPAVLPLHSGRAPATDSGRECACVLRISGRYRSATIVSIGGGRVDTREQ